MKRGISALIMAAVLAAPAASALGGSWPAGMGKHDGKFWKRDKVRRELQLSDDTVRDLEAIFAKNEQTLIDLEADVKKKRAALDRVFTNDEADETEVLAQVDLVERARANLGKARVIMLLEMRRLLTPAQREKLADFDDED